MKLTLNLPVYACSTSLQGLNKKYSFLSSYFKYLKLAFLLFSTSLHPQVKKTHCDIFYIFILFVIYGKIT